MYPLTLLSMKQSVFVKLFWNYSLYFGLHMVVLTMPIALPTVVN